MDTPYWPNVEKHANEMFWKYLRYCQEHCEKAPLRTLEREAFLSSLEEQMDIADSEADDFRRSFLAWFGHQMYNLGPTAASKLNWQSHLQLAISKLLCFKSSDMPTKFPKYRSIDEPWEIR